jgi:hypothetical protein
VDDPGFGKPPWFEAKRRVEDCLSIDVRRWKKEGVLEPGRGATAAWYRDGRKDSSMGIRALHGAVELSYSVRPSRTWYRREDVSYKVPLAWTPCNFGGERPWFSCPGIVNGVACGRRVAKLYLRGRYFLCRHCHDLTYASRQQRSALKVAERKCRRIRRKLGGSLSVDEPFPRRPKRMHPRTYLRLFEEYEKAHEEYARALGKYAERLTRRWSGAPGKIPSRSGMSPKGQERRDAGLPSVQERGLSQDG